MDSTVFAVLAGPRKPAPAWSEERGARPCRMSCISLVFRHPGTWSLKLHNDSMNGLGRKTTTRLSMYIHNVDSNLTYNTSVIYRYTYYYLYRDWLVYLYQHKYSSMQCTPSLLSARMKDSDGIDKKSWTIRIFLHHQTVHAEKVIAKCANLCKYALNIH